MESGNTFKFSNEEVKKMNYLLPKGYKFVQRDEIEKKQSQKTIKKKIIPPPVQTFTPAPQIKPRIEKVKEEQYEPKVKIPVPPTLIPPPIILPNEGPAGTSQKLLEKIQKYQVFHSLMRVPIIKSSDISLKQIENKVNTLGLDYKILDLKNDIENFCMMVYKQYAKTSSEYREASELQNYLQNLMIFEKVQVKKFDNYPLLTKLSSTQSNNPAYRKRIQPVNRSVYQPLIQTKAPTPSQKRLLGQMIKKLPSQSLQQVCYIVFESIQNREYMFDLDTLHVKKFRELEEYVKKCMEKTGEWDQRNYDDQEYSNQSVFVIEDDNQ